METKEKVFIRIKNFRSFEDVNIELRPINLLFGPNGSGKSSFLKAIRFLSHNLFRLDDVDFYAGSKPETWKYVLDKETDLLSFKEIVRDNNIKNRISFELTILNAQLNYYPLDEMLNISSLRVAIDSLRPPNGKPLPKNEITNIKLIFEIFLDEKLYEVISITVCDLENQIEYKFIPGSRIINGNQQLVDCAISIGGENEYAEIIESFIKKIDCLPFISTQNKQFALNNNVVDFVELIENIKGNESVLKLYELFCQILTTYYKIFYAIPDKIKEYFFTINHLPSLREIPKSVFLLKGGKFSEFDYYGIPLLLSGDNGTAYVSDLDKYPESLDNSKLKEKNLFLTFNLISYPDLVNRILNDLNLAKEIKANKDNEKLAGWLSYVSNDGKVISNLSEASSGLLQILPIITTIVRSADDAGTRIGMIEQPELHLHPKLQAALADFFTSKNIRIDNIIIETHSEHIIRRIQVLIAQSNKESGSENLKQKIGVHYISKDKKKGVTTIKEMKLDDNGFFQEPWPDGFFDDSYNLTKELLKANKN